MQTTVDVDQPRPPARRWFRWLAVGLAVVAVGAALLLRGLASEAVEPTLEEQLAVAVVDILESATPEEHADHGHHFGDEGRILCVAEVFGFDPPAASSLEEVAVVYAQHMCAVIAVGQGWPDAVRASGPLKVDLVDPPQVLLPDQVDLGPDAVHVDRVRELFPERYHEPALALGFADPGLSDVLRERLEAAS